MPKNDLLPSPHLLVKGRIIQTASCPLPALRASRADGCLRGLCVQVIVHLHPQRRHATAMGRPEGLQDWSTWCQGSAGMCVYIHTYTCIYIYIYIYLCVCLLICSFIYLFTYIFINISIYLFIYLSIYLFICVCVHICVYLYIYIYLFIYLNIIYYI